MSSRLTDIPAVATRSLLDDALPPIMLPEIALPQAAGGPYGVISSGLPLPATGGSYVVDFMGANAFGACQAHVLAYIDPFGRVFHTEKPIEIPPACTPCLSFARFPDTSVHPDQGVQQGCVYVHEEDGSQRDVAQYRCRSERYALFDTWYAFGSHGFDLSYDEAFARAYLAFVYRPQCGATPVPARGVEGVFQLYAHHFPLRAFRLTQELVQHAARDATFRVPALVKSLVAWLEAAGLDEVQQAKRTEADLRLVRTINSADIFYLGRENPDSPISDRQVWALEAALNRFKLIADQLGDRVSSASEADCVRWDHALINGIGSQEPIIDDSEDVPQGASEGEWALRCGVASALEHAQLPFRVMVDMRADLTAGMVALRLVVPDGSFMPEWRASDDDHEAGDVISGATRRRGLVWASAADREEQAQQYAMHAGLLLASAAFLSSSAVTQVFLEAHTLPAVKSADTSHEAARLQAVATQGSAAWSASASASGSGSGSGATPESAPGSASALSTASETAPESAPASESGSVPASTSASTSASETAAESAAALVPSTEQGTAYDRADTTPAAERIEEPELYYQVVFDRALYDRRQAFASERIGDASALFAACAWMAQTGNNATPSFSGMVPSISVFDEFDKLPSALFRRRAPELCDAALEGSSSAMLGACELSELRIQSDSELRIAGEQLADSIVQTQKVSDAIGVVRAAEEQAKHASDEPRQEACRRLMAALVDGSIDKADQNTIVSRFLGEDRCQRAVAQARALGKNKRDEAIRILVDAVAEVTALEGVLDSSSLVYRTFDSYASRVLYNVARTGSFPWTPQVAPDVGKELRLVSDSFYLCHLDLVSLLEDSFERADEALHYGKRACEMAPTTLVGFRTLARAFMLTGDMENAAETLQKGLLIAVQPSDVAVSYYQLAYVLWRLGRPRAGAVCYLKSMQMAPTMQVQATTELKELLDETGIAMPSFDTVDIDLGREGLILAPTPQVLDVLERAAAAAVDEGLFVVARNLLSLCLRYRPNDALTTVLASLQV